ncbi:MAG: PDZ domain-containing protein [Candidatus Aminicenantes bacterium]|nr:PDZ domain-containing protein [Candidatus Aminicenantes bacterium]
MNDKNRPAKVPVQKYHGWEIRTDLVDGKIQYRPIENNSVDFILDENCQVKDLKIKVNDREIVYHRVEKVVENGQIEKNDLFAYILYDPEIVKGSTMDPEELLFKFYRGKISLFINADYPLYPTLKLTTDKLGLKLPHRTFVVLSGFGGAVHEFFCYLERENAADEINSSDPCLLSFEQALEIHYKDQNSTALKDLGEKYARRLDYEKAEKAYIKAFSLPEEHDYEPLLSLYFNTNQMSKAKKFILDALDRSPMKYDLYVALARVYLAEGEYEKAVSAALAAQKLNPEKGLFKSYDVLARAYLKQQKFVEAIEALRRAAVLAEKECQENQDFFRSFFNEPEEKEREFNCRLSRVPYELSIIYALSALEKYEQAEEGAKALLQVMPENPFIYGWLGLVKAARGENGKALEMAEKSLSLFKRKGIGASISQGEIYPLIVAVQKGTPAEQAGLKIGDRIVAVNSQDVRLLREEEDPTQMVARIFKTQERAKLLIHRPGSLELKEVEVQVEEYWPEEAGPVLKLKEQVAGSKRKIDLISLRKLMDEFYEKQPWP